MGYLEKRRLAKEARKGAVDRKVYAVLPKRNPYVELSEVGLEPHQVHANLGMRATMREVKSSLRRIRSERKATYVYPMTLTERPRRWFRTEIPQR